MRVYLLYLVVAALAAYAWRDWFKSLCGVCLLALIGTHRQMPGGIAGIQGLNPWNVLLLFVALAWLVNRRREGLVWDMPRGVTLLLGAWAIVILVAGIRTGFDLASYPQLWYRATGLDVLTEFIFNPVKYVLPAIMLYDGCRTRSRMITALACLVPIGAIYGLLVIRTIPVSTLFLQEGLLTYRMRVLKEIGLHPNNMGPLLAGFFWATIVCFVFLKHWSLRMMSGVAAASTFLGMALCQSRAGYLSFAATGLVLGLVRWRPLLVIVPLAAMIVTAVFPSVPSRVEIGFGAVDVSGEAGTDWGEVTAGRSTDLWPFCIDQIAQSPLVGFGRDAVIRKVYLLCDPAAKERPVAHPHNAYLEQLLDTGAIGLAVTLALYGAALVTAIRLCREKRDVLAATVGGITLACVTALLVAGISGQTLWPSPSSVFLWCFCGILLRVWVTLRRARAIQYQSVLPQRLAAKSGRYSPASLDCPR